MSRPKILVTGATGRTGAAVVSELLKAGCPVRATVRREDARAAGQRRRDRRGGIHRHGACVGGDARRAARVLAAAVRPGDADGRRRVRDCCAGSP